MPTDSKSPVLGTQLRSARQGLKLSLQQVAAELGVDPQALARWEDGSAEPSAEQVSDLAELYGRNVDYFLAETPPLPPRINFRLARRKSMTELPPEARRVIARFEELCRAADELDRLAGRTRAVTVGKSPAKGDADALSARERERLGLGDGPVRDMRAVLESQGVRVFELPVPEAEFSGLSWWHERYGPSVLVNARDIPGRRSFSLAHEYAHVLRSGAPFICDLSLDLGEERFASMFAAAFLMPASDLREVFLSRGLYGKTPTVDELRPLARRYSVSLEALSIRLERLGLVPGGTTSSLVEARPKYLRRPKIPSWRRQLGESYVSTALQLRSDGRISTGKLAQYLGIDVRSAIALAGEGSGAKPDRD